MKTTTAPTVDELKAEWEKARDRRNLAAVFLAYDMAIRADDPYTTERPTPEHVEEMKSEYRAAHYAERAAWELFHAAW